MQKQPNVNFTQRIDALQPGVPFCSVFRIQKDGDQVTLSDRTGTISGKITSTSINSRQEIDTNCSIVAGFIDEQCRLNAVSIVGSDWIGTPFALALPDLPGSIFNADLDKLTAKIQDFGLRCLLNKVFLDEQRCRKFLETPVSLHGHHRYSGGLAKHTLEVASLCWQQSTGFSQLDREILLTAALLHDIHKITDQDVTQPSSRDDFVAHLNGAELLSQLLDEVWVFCHPTRLALMNVLGERVAQNHSKNQRYKILADILYLSNEVSYSRDHHVANDDITVRKAS